MQLLNKESALQKNTTNSKEVQETKDMNSAQKKNNTKKQKQNQSIVETPNKEESPSQKINKKKGKQALEAEAEVQQPQVGKKGKKRQNVNENTPDSTLNKKTKLDSQKGEKKPSNKKAKMNAQKGPKISACELQIYFPHGATSYKEAIQLVLNNCKLLNNPRTINIKYESPEEAQKMIPTLSDIKVEGRPIVVKQLIEKLDPLKRVIYFKDNNKPEGVKSFFDAESIERMKIGSRFINLHVLSFESEDAAAAASKKTMKLDNQDVALRPYIQRESKRHNQSDDAETPEKKRKQNGDEGQRKKAKTALKAPQKTEDDEDEDDDDEDDDDDEEEEATENAEEEGDDDENAQGEDDDEEDDDDDEEDE